MGGMNATGRDAGLNQMRAYVTTLQPLMQLQHWEIEIAPNPPEDEDASASIHMHDGTWSAWLKLSDWFLQEADANRQRIHIVHELVHIYFRAMETAQAALITHFTMPQWSLIDARFDVEKERAIDAIARVIAPHLPLPPTVEGKQSTVSGPALRQDTYVRVVTPGPLQGKVGYLRSCPPDPGPDAALGVEGLHAAELGRVEAFKPRDLLPAEQPQEAQ